MNVQEQRHVGIDFEKLAHEGGGGGEFVCGGHEEFGFFEERRIAYGYEVYFNLCHRGLSRVFVVCCFSGNGSLDLSVPKSM